MGMNGKDDSALSEGEFSKSCKLTFRPERAMDDDDVDAEVPSSGSKVHP